MSLASVLIRRLERRTGEAADHLRRIHAAWPGGFWRLMLLMPLMGGPRHAPARLFHLARLGAALREDCGACVAIELRFAKTDGVDAGTLHQAMKDRASLPAHERAAFDYGWHVAGAEAIPDEIDYQLRTRCGEAGFVELAIAATTARVFPAVKRGLGYAKTCDLKALEAA